MKNRYRSIWLRRGDSSNPVASGKEYCMMLSAIGNAAARETLVTATPHMAAIWTDQFDSLLVSKSSSLCWRGSGPGIGRDARSAYSGLLGRYMARAYLTEHEGVRVLVPLDEAKRRLEETRYVIKKDPPSQGYEADWIGLDDSGLVIVEAKGTFNDGIKPWQGPSSKPQVLQIAIEQAERTAVFCCPRRKLPAKRWAIASRWGTEENCRKPTLLAWDVKEKQLDENDCQANDHRELYDILHRADVGGVLEGMGHSIDTRAQDVKGLIAGVRPSRLIIDRQPLGSPGFAAVVGPFGVRPLFPGDEVRDLNFSYAVASLSHSYVLEGHIEKGLTVSVQRDFESQSTFTDVPERFATRRGLTVVWLRPGENVAFEEE